MGEPETNIYGGLMSTYRELKTSIIAPQESFKGMPSSDQKPPKLLTPEGLFFDRNLQTIPEIDLENYQLTVKGMVKKELCLSYEDIVEEFPKVIVLANVQGDEELNDNVWNKPEAGLVKFAGIRLRHVLLAAGVNPDTQYVAFSGLDEEQADGSGNNFAGLLPIRKALSPEVILAYEMNDEPLPIAQGFPLRVIIPGNDNALRVKWISEIRLLGEVIEGQKITPEKKQVKVDSLPDAPAVIAVICNPRDGETVLDDLVIVEGYAMAIEGRPIVRVELSSDGGRNWTAANILKNDNPWAWCFWESYLKLHSGSHQILVQAYDDEGNSNGIQKTHPHSISLKIVEDE
jgi:sulfite oxidase